MSQRKMSETTPSQKTTDQRPQTARDDELGGVAGGYPNDQINLNYSRIDYGYRE